MKNDLIKIWRNLVTDINNESLICSSEKAICFQYAWRLKEKFKDSIDIDFEKRLYENEFSDGMFLDLLIERNNQKVGFEFKFMKSDDLHNTNQTETRVKIINDLKRLTYLKERKKISNGYFLCLTNEMPYTYKGNKTKNPDFRTYHNETYKKNAKFPVDNIHSKEDVKCLKDIKFEWNGIESSGSRYKLREKIKYAWLTPIEI